MMKLLEQASVGKDSPKAQPGCPHKDKKRGGAPTGRKESGQLTKVKEAEQQTNCEEGSKLESLSDSDSEAG